MPTEPTNDTPLDWQTAPHEFRDAHAKQQQRIQELEQTAQRAAQLERQNAMLQAGVDMSHPAAAYFLDGYKGELDTDAIKAEWVKLAPPSETPPAGDGQGGETTPPTGDGSTPPPSDNPTEEERQLQERLAALRSGSTPPGGEPSADPMDDAIHGYVEDRKQGATQVRAQRNALQKIFNAAAAGDERVVSNSAGEAKEKWEQRHGLTP